MIERPDFDIRYAPPVILSEAKDPTQAGSITGLQRIPTQTLRQLSKCQCEASQPSRLL